MMIFKQYYSASIFAGLLAFVTSTEAADQKPAVVQAATIKLGTQTVLKGLAIEAGDLEKASFCYDTETMRLAGVWRGGFIDPVRLMSRGEYPIAQGKIAIESGVMPGAVIGDAIGDPRPGGVGLLSSDSVRYRGFHRFEDRIVLSYEVAGIGVLEHPWFDSLEGVFQRSFRVEASTNDLRILMSRTLTEEEGDDIVERVGNGSHGYVALNGGGTNFFAVGILDGPKEAIFEVLENHLYLKLPARDAEGSFQ
ncbi:hypothetical protein N9B94_04975, partial [Verrucomicrobia bacterium]|nr:hypothetical protein [Verrucomicrobiota bacterium]